MTEENGQRVYLTCGSVFLVLFCFAAAIAILRLGAGVRIELIAVIVLAVTMAILLFNSTLLCGSNGGLKVLKISRTLLWLSFFLMTVAIGLCIVSMAGSL